MTKKPETSDPIIVRETKEPGKFEIKFETKFANNATETYTTITTLDELKSVKDLAEMYSQVLHSCSGQEGTNIKLGLPIALYKLRDSGIPLKQFLDGSPSSQILNDACTKHAKLMAREFAAQVEVDVSVRVRGLQESIGRDAETLETEAVAAR